MAPLEFYHFCLLVAVNFRLCLIAVWQSHRFIRNVLVILAISITLMMKKIPLSSSTFVQDKLCMYLKKISFGMEVVQGKFRVFFD